MQKKNFYYVFERPDQSREEMNEELPLSTAIEEARNFSNGGIYVVSMDQTVPRSDFSVYVSTDELNGLSTEQVEILIERRIGERLD